MKCTSKTWCHFVANPPIKGFNDQKFYVVVRLRGRKYQPESRRWWEIHSHVKKTIWGIIKFCTQNGLMRGEDIEIFEFDFKNANMVYKGKAPT